MANEVKSHVLGLLRDYTDAERLAKAAAELFVHTARESVSARGRFRVSLSGGSTPRRVYELLASPTFSNRIDWDHVDLFWGDERYVPADDRDSNFRMTSEALLRHIAIPATSIHRVPTEISPPEAAAAAYEKEIRHCFRASSSIPQLDLIYLGLGTNGHVASLFPHSSTLKESSRLALADFVSEVNTWRITMSAPLLNNGRIVAFLVQGKQKAQVLCDVLFGPRDPEHLPAQIIAPKGKLLWMADKAAAALVSRAEEQRSA